jgi:hypothetical protein
VVQSKTDVAYQKRGLNLLARCLSIVACNEIDELSEIVSYPINAISLYTVLKHFPNAIVEKDEEPDKDSEKYNLSCTTVEECQTLMDGRDVPRVRVNVSDHEPNPNLQIALDKIKEFCTSQKTYSHRGVSIFLFPGTKVEHCRWTFQGTFFAKKPLRGADM